MKYNDKTIRTLATDWIYRGREEKGWVIDDMQEFWIKEFANFVERRIKHSLTKG